MASKHWDEKTGRIIDDDGNEYNSKGDRLTPDQVEQYAEGRADAKIRNGGSFLDDVIDTADFGNLVHSDNAEGRAIDADIAELNNKRGKTEEEMQRLAQLTAQKREAEVREREDPALANLQGAANGRDRLADSLVADQAAAGYDLNRSNQNLAGEARQLAGDTNSQGFRDLDQYTTQSFGLDEQDQGSLAKFQQQYDKLRPLDQQAKWDGDLKSDAGTVAAQKGAQSTLAGYGQGGLDYSSKASGAKADATAVAAQGDALAKFGELAGQSGETADEQLQRELARGEQFRQEKSNRDAVMRNLSDRGMSGSGQLLAMTRSASAQNSQNRLFSDLAGRQQAGARQRDALAQYGSLAGTMRDASFGEDFNRGQSADLASRMNASNRLAGTQAAGTQANAIRGDEDALSQFNRTESLKQSNLQDEWKQSERDKAAERASEQLAQGRLSTDQLSGRADSRYDKNKGANDAAYGRSQDALSADQRAQQAKYGITQDWIGAAGAAGDTKWSGAKDIFDANRGVAQDVVGLQGQEADRLEKALDKRVATYNSDIAAKEGKRPTAGIMDIFK